MLSDRPYMFRSRRDPAAEALQGMYAVWVLIALNVLFFLMFPPESAFNEYGYNPYSTYARLALWAHPGLFHGWQLITYLFLHGSFSHLFFNMYGLYLFGKLVAPILGRGRFLALYFLSGIVGGGLWIAANWGQAVPAVGASGALFGVMLAVAMMQPDLQFMLLFPPVPLKAKTLVIVYAILEIFSNWSLHDNIAHLAHLGGFVGAYVFLELFCRREIVWDVLPHGRRFRQTPPVQSGSTADGPKFFHFSHKSGGPVSKDEVDRLLDKISQEGINSLTPEEYATLQRAREQMRGSGR